MQPPHTAGAVYAGYYATFCELFLHIKRFEAERLEPWCVLWPALTFIFLTRETWLCTRLELGKRAFAVAAPAAWNSLPDDVRSAPTLDKFKQCLKTHLFIQSYYS